MSSIDQQFVEYIVKSLVGKPEAVQIERRIDEKGVLLELTVDPEDLGRVIGKRGATAQSIRNLLRALGTKNDARYNLKIVDNGYPRPERQDRPAEPTAQPAAQADEPADGTSDDQVTEDTEEVENAEELEVPAAVEPEAPAEVADLEDEDEEVAPTSGSVVDKTREELKEYDDLDV